MEKIKTIHYLRGIAALLVVCFHIREYINGVYAQQNLGDLLFLSGASGVDLFFIISGFIIAMSTDKKHETTRTFIIKRIFRIYPVFIVSLMIFISINNVFPLNEIIRSAMFLHRNYESSAPFYGYNILYPAWTLTYEIYFYAVFVISLAISKKHVVVTASFILAAPVLFFQLYFNGEISLSADTNINASIPLLEPTIKLLSSPMMVEFIYGMVLYKLYNAFKNYRTVNITIISVFLTGTYVCMFFSGYRFGYGPVNFGLWALVLLIGCLLYERFNSVADYKVLNTLGDYSYSMYLSHAFIISFFQKNPDMIPIYSMGNGIPKMMFTILCVVLVSYLLLM
ncbi:acyltransferase family protein [Enterobacter asburiae]|uniref:acyltransferase family protein n=1 Tax=Enterobacter asburiae TaxID=61645 RepID=UPI0021C9B8C7|nr:acyltransferase [Enterobacter asburiae]MCU3444550.1 acyltransferase [Enterobacter asburiae]